MINGYSSARRDDCPPTYITLVITYKKTYNLEEGSSSMVGAKYAS
tara:strand:+ start:13918 stop:14052 length:135 start_codon:yes stop_codon:yes gene_type:complete